MGVFDTIDSEKIELTENGAMLLSVMTVALADLEDKDLTGEL